MKVSDYIIDFIVAQKVTHVFEVCGGAITHLLDSLYGRKDIEVVSMHHEQAASFAAEGYARAGGNVGVAMATSGPGATNLITGIASCFFDSIPCVFITGQVNTYEFKFNSSARQVGFQETDIVSVVKPIVKEAIFVSDPKKIRYVLEKAFYVAKNGRPGPVLIDIPMNIQRSQIRPKQLKSFKIGNKNTIPNKSIIKKVSKLIDGSERPVLLLGGGVKLSGAYEEIAKFVKKTNIPVCSTLMGLGAFPGNNRSFVGMIGTYGNRYANLTVANSDLLIAIGTRFDTRQTGTDPGSFGRGAKIVHVDIDRSELNNKVKADIVLNCDASVFLKAVNKEIKSYNKKSISGWKKIVSGYKNNYPSYVAHKTDNSIYPNSLMSSISKVMSRNTIAFVDVGQNQMWAAQSLSVGFSQNLFTQGGMGAMGSALSMAIGACFTNKASSYLVITGDGGFQLNIQELETIKKYNLPIKIILLNNNCYGMVRQFQEQYFNSRFQSTVKGYSSPNFQKIVSAYGIPVFKLKTSKNASGMLKKIFKKKGPVFLEADIKKKHKVLPKLSVNMPIEKQDPQLSKKEQESNMLIDLI